MWDDLRGPLLELGRDLLHAAILFVEAALILIIAYRLGRVGQNRIEVALSRRAYGANGAVLIGRLTAVAIMIVALLIVLGRFGANWTGLLAVVSAGTVAIGLALQDVLKNFVAGVYLLLERPFLVGDAIRVKDVEGTVHGIDIRATVIRNLRGELVLVPNATIFTETLTNRSRSGTRRLDLTISESSLSAPELLTVLSTAFDGHEYVQTPVPLPIITQSDPEGLQLAWSLLYVGDKEGPNKVLTTLHKLLPRATIRVDGV
ncbi:MAG: mechanosensitive ion channel family protein [Chloroflexota bacterium]|nr:mechanosensitive ion channel family protein [Chloroflexota bacterium]